MGLAPQPALQRRRLAVEGLVQGVGFRPFVHRLAARAGLAGFVLNDAGGVVIEVEGDAERLDAFAAALRAEAPPLARIEAVSTVEMEPLGVAGFAISPSARGAPSTLVAPDAATCEDCLRELLDPADRRHRYPFINCTNCGPRFTIVRGIPYDRAHTTMAGFAMCADCRREYEDPDDRRFHAEPNACPACGPRLSMPLEAAVGALRAGSIVAVKGLGGWHLACDAASEPAVARLRARKQREQKPFALMAADARELCVVGARDQELLCSPERPIVLMPRKAGAAVAKSVAPGCPWLGVMLPYTPLHHLLVHDFGGPLVMTSGNRSDEPIAVADADARERLTGIADAFLSHDRPIHRRCEDSVARAGFRVRRSRGFAPSPVTLPVAAGVPLVAAGAELKSTFCVARGREGFISPHLGDLDNAAAYRAFRGDLELYLSMLGVRRASRSARKPSPVTSSRRSRLVAATMRTSTARALLAPTGRISRASSARRRRACRSAGSSPISSR
jgi:hydrogenase maturation protein HypF